jgi:molecular chaperone DnaK
LAEDDKTRLEAAVATLKEALGGSDIEAIKRATEELGTAGQAAGQKLYEQAAASAQAAGGDGGSSAGGSGDSSRPSDDDIVDAEIVDEK